MRHVILHYHLFKNAGTSLDHVLRQNFKGRWETAEFPMQQPNTPAVRDWISAHPDAIAFSSHTMIGPLPDLPGVKITPILLLRDPIARISSAYRFERTQNADTLGATLAKTHDLSGYVRARLSRTGDRQCRNFQTARLATMIDKQGPEIARAKEAIARIQHLGVLGLVSQFDMALTRLKLKIAPAFPTFSADPIRRNASTGDMSNQLGPDLHQDLVAANADDLALIDFARSRLTALEVT